MTDHELYEVLCTLAATGQLAAPEKANFDEHCLHCPACRDQLQDLIYVGVQLQLDAAIHTTSASLPAGSLERFCARAIREGIAPSAASVRPSPSYALASAAAVLVIVAALVFMPHGRKAAESFAVSTAAPIPTRQSFSASVTRRALIPQPSKAVHAHFVRHDIVPHTDIGVNDASLTARRFPQAITTSYPFFGPQSATKSSLTGYPALSRSQISRLDLFRNLDHSNGRKPAGIATPDRPIDIASTGNVFDFAANIRQLHFQLPTAQ
jgi:hypothetical protein